MINIQDQFSVNIGLPIDKRIVANGTAGRNAITYKYDGLLVFDTSDRRTYVWNSANNAWGAADVSGAGQIGYLPKWQTTTGLTFSNIFISNVTNNYLAKVGINTNGATVREVFQVNSANTGSPPVVIHKGAVHNIIASNWYNNGVDNYFDASIGSHMIFFRDNGETWLMTRGAGAGNPPINSSAITDDINIMLYPSTVAQLGVRIVKNTTFNHDNSAGSAAFIRVNNNYSTPLTPDYTWWYNDQNGFYHPSSNTIGVSIAGLQKAIFNSTGLLISSTNNITSPQRNLHVDSGTGNAAIIQLTNGTTSGTGNNSGFHIGLNSAAYPYLSSRTGNPFLFVWSDGNSRHRFNSNQYLMYSNSGGENFATISASNGGGGSRVVRGTKLIVVQSSAGPFVVETLSVPSSSQVAIEATFVSSKDSPKQFTSKKIFAQYTVNSSGVLTSQNTGGSVASGVSLAMLSSSSATNITNAGSFDYATANQIKMVVNFSSSGGSGASVVSFTATINTIRGH